MNGSSSTNRETSPYDIVDTLDDPECRDILRTLNYPMTAAELVEACDVPKTILNQKMDRLLNTSLVRKEVYFEENGCHRLMYKTNFEEVTVELDEEQNLCVEIK